MYYINAIKLDIKEAIVYEKVATFLSLYKIETSLTVNHSSAHYIFILTNGSVVGAENNRLHI